VERFTAVQARLASNAKQRQFAKLDQTLQARSFSSQTLQIDELIDEPFGIDMRLARNSCHV
jgi:hypothetical protein